MIIEEYVEHIERLKLRRDFADGNEDYHDSERAQLERDIKASRASIVDHLTNDELRALKEQGLKPEQAMRVLRDPQAPEPTAIEKALNEIKAQRQLADLASREFYIADKGAHIDAGKTVAESGLIKRLSMPSTRPVPTASIGDAFLNHNGRTER
jgi:hypothetical protein